MKIVIISDVHGNYDALSHLPEDYDQLWVLGDLVNYGPQPAEVVNFVRRHAAHVVRGNHDHSIGFGEAPRCTPRFREMAETTRRYTEAILSEDDKKYLRSLPLQTDVWVGKTRCRLCHALPSDPPFKDYPSQFKGWEDECRRVGAELLFVAGGHVSFGIKVGSTLLVNPGSLGQPRSGERRLWSILLVRRRVDRNLAHRIGSARTKSKRHRRKPGPLKLSVSNFR